MQAWNFDTQRLFNDLMSSLWKGWSTSSDELKKLYVNSLSRFKLPVVRSTVEAIRRSQDIERVPSVSRIVQELKDHERIDNMRAKAMGTPYASKLERDMAILCEHCIEIQDSKNTWWRFIPEGLCCEATNTVFPWTAAKPGQVERLVERGVGLLGTTGGEPLLTAEQFAAEEDFWEPRLADPKKAAWWKHSRGRLSQGRLPEILEAVIDTPLEHEEPTAFEVGDGWSQEVPF
jgi:hypothetical protein